MTSTTEDGSLVESALCKVVPESKSLFMGQPAELLLMQLRLAIGEEDTVFYITTRNSTSRDYTAALSIRMQQGAAQHEQRQSLHALLRTNKIVMATVEDMRRKGNAGHSFTIVLECTKKHNIFTATKKRHEEIEPLYGQYVRTVNIVIAAEHDFECLDSFVGTHKHGQLLHHFPELCIVNVCMVAKRAPSDDRSSAVDHGVLFQSLSRERRQHAFAAVRLVERLIPEAKRQSVDMKFPTVDACLPDSSEIAISASIKHTSMAKIHNNPRLKHLGLDTLERDDDLDGQVKRIRRLFSDPMRVVTAVKAEMHNILQSHVGWTPIHNRAIESTVESLCRAARGV